MIGAASIFAAVLTWVLQAMSGRLLGPEDFAAFMVIWGFVFLEVGLLQGLQQEVNRAVARSEPVQRAERTPAWFGGRTVRLGLLCGCAGAAGLMATSPLWADRIFGAGWFSITAAAAFAFASYALYSVVNGALAGRKRWGDYSVSIAVESVLRLVLVLTVISLGSGLAGQAWGLAGAGLTWVVLLGRTGFRSAASEVGDVTLPVMAAGAAHAMVAAGCSAILIAGFPVLMKITTTGALPPEAGVVLAAVVATRAPLLLPLNAFQAVLLSRFVLAREEIMRTLGRLLALVALVTVAGAGLAYVAGPLLLRLLYGDAYVIGPVLIAVLVVGAGLITMQTMSGSAVLALNHHRLFAAGWVVATAVAVAMLSLELSVGVRSAWALTTGPLTGLLVNIVTLAVHGARRP
jgi:O-antigen/teichoic acid export membrane protein